MLEAPRHGAVGIATAVAYIEVGIRSVRKVIAIKVRNDAGFLIKLLTSKTLNIEKSENQQP